MESNTMWMPHKEYELWQEMKSKMSPEAEMKMAYYFWNNFSLEGWDKYLANQILQAEKEGKTLIDLKTRYKKWKINLQ